MTVFRIIFCGSLLLVCLGSFASSKLEVKSFRRPAGTSVPFPNDGTHSIIVNKSDKYIGIYIEGPQAKEIFEHMAEAKETPNMTDNSGKVVYSIRRGECQKQLIDQDPYKTGDYSCLISFDRKGHIN